MKKIKTIASMVEKALRTGEANKNGRMSYWGGYKGTLEEQYNISVSEDILRMRHWGTETLVIDLTLNEVIEHYGESNSDRDSMNTVLGELGIPGTFRYFPSKDKFVYEL